MSSASPASPSSPPDDLPSPWEEDEGAMRAEDVYTRWLLGDPQA